MQLLKYSNYTIVYEKLVTGIVRKLFYLRMSCNAFNKNTLYLKYKFLIRCCNFKVCPLFKTLGKTSVQFCKGL